MGQGCGAVWERRGSHAVVDALSRNAKTRYIAKMGKRAVMRTRAVIAAALAILWTQTGISGAAPKKKPEVLPRTASGTVIQPTRTIIHNPNGTTTVIVTPRRSYLDTGTEVSVGDRGYRDYMLPPGGDPGRPHWFFGPDLGGSGSYMVGWPFYLPGHNPNNPF